MLDSSSQWLPWPGISRLYKEACCTSHERSIPPWCLFQFLTQGSHLEFLPWPPFMVDCNLKIKSSQMVLILVFITVIKHKLRQTATLNYVFGAFISVCHSAYTNQYILINNEYKVSMGFRLDIHKGSLSWRRKQSFKGRFFCWASDSSCEISKVNI